MKSLRLCLAFSLLMAASAAAEIRDKGWWKHMVFYQIYPRSFKDSNGEGVGDLIGVTSRLEHFVESGIGAIWLSPINKSPMVDFGYDISDYKDIDPIFGTLADFDNLVKRAKQLGLKVILDLVPNHTSDMHDWFKRSVKNESNYADYYIWRSGSPNKPPNNWISVFGGPAWTYHPQRKQWYFHQFAPQQPDLNYFNPKVKEEMKNVMLFWLNRGVDGFRVDAVPHLFEDEKLTDEPRSFLPGVTDKEYKYLEHIHTKDHPETYKLVQSWREILDNFANTHNSSEKVMMTEAYTSMQNTTRFYGSGSHIPFNFRFIMEVNKDSPATKYKQIIDEWMAATPKDGAANWVMGNHDRKRTATRFPGRGDAMTMLEMILPGVAVTYNGEEIGMLDNNDITFEEGIDPQGCNAGRQRFKEESRDFCRTPFQWNSQPHAGFTNGSKTWLPVNKNYRELNLENQKKSSESPYKVYQALTNLRKTSSALQKGNVFTFVFDDILVVSRRDGLNMIILLMNVSNTKSHQVDLDPKTNTVAVVTSVGANIPKGVKLTNVVLRPNAAVALKTSVDAGKSVFLNSNIPL